MGIDFHNAVHVHQFFLRLLGFGDVCHMHHIPVAEYRGIDFIEQTVLVIFLKGLHGLVSGHEFHGFHIVDGQNGIFQVLCLRLRVVLVHKCNDFILFFQFGNDIVDVQCQQAENAHDNQASHNDGHGSKGHETMFKDALKALFGEVSKIIQSHMRNTHPFRRQ